MMRRLRETFIIVGLLLLIVAVYSASLDRTMQCDEANTLYKYASNPLSALFGYTTPNNHLFHSFLVWITTSLMGFSHIAVRYTAFMASVLTFAMAYRVGRKTLNHYSGIATMGLLGISLGVAGFSLDARGYTLSALLTLILIDLIFLSPHGNIRRLNYGVLLVSFLLLMVLPSMILLIIPILLWKLWEYKQIRRSKHIQQIFSICVGGLSAFFFYLPAILEGSALEHLSRFGEPDFITLVAHWLELVYSPSILGIPALILIAIGFSYLIVKSDKTNLLVGIILIVVIAIGVALIQYLLTDRTLYARNYFYLVSVFALLGGVGLTVILRRWVIPVAYILILIMSIFVPHDHLSEAIEQLIDAIPQYQPDVELLPNHACHIVAAYYEITETQGNEVITWAKESQVESVMIPIPVGFDMPIERAIEDNGYERDDFGECNFVDDEFDWLDVYVCETQ